LQRKRTPTAPTTALSTTAPPARSFDADGNGGGAAVQFATLAAGLALTNNEFIVRGP
jgi:hypothetical protein